LAPINTSNQEVLRRWVEFTQYTSLAFGRRCKELGVRPSMGSVGDAYDNAMAESFFASLECELLDRRTFKTKIEARLAVFTWIEAWYNPRRRHSALGHVSPINFERNHHASCMPLRALNTTYPPSASAC
jgi:putative transposase